MLSKKKKTKKKFSIEIYTHKQHKNQKEKKNKKKKKNRNLDREYWSRNLVVFKNNQCTNNHNRAVGEEKNLIDKRADKQPLIVDTSSVSFFLYPIPDLFYMVVDVLE